MKYTLHSTPEAGRGQVLYSGEVLKITLDVEGGPLPPGIQAFVRSDVNSAPSKRRQIIERVEQDASHFAVGWHDIAMKRAGDSQFVLEIIVNQPGYYEYKPYVKLGAEIIWPGGDNSSVAVHPLKWRGANTIYSAFPRQFGPYKELDEAADRYETEDVQRLEDEGFTVIPPSGTFQNLEEHLPFLFNELGIRILHLLPVQETPTHYARMGRYGSPYAAADMRSVNHAYCEFRTDSTPNEQFQELCAQVHAYGGDILLDMAVNHLGWSTELLNEHPEWFVRRADQHFVSPGAWGVTWEDLVELDFSQKDVWKYLADSLLLWCERGVDGFRADAGYQVPVEVWEYVTARVHEIYPETLFLLEGLGGAWDSSEAILKHGGMQWAYSEMFQQEGSEMLEGYLKHLNRISLEVGILANYAETHDNNRLAQRGPGYVKHRLALCALTSSAGAFGFTNGVEWLATEKVNVHGSSALRWDNKTNIVHFVRDLNALLKTHPIFRGPAEIALVEGMPKNILAFERIKDQERLLVLANLNESNPQDVVIPEANPAYRCLISGREINTDSEVRLDPYEMICLDINRPTVQDPAQQIAAVRQHDEAAQLRRILAEFWGETFDLTGFNELVTAVNEQGLKALLAVSDGGPKNAGELASRIRDLTSADLFLGVSEWNSSHGDRVHVMCSDQLLYLEEDVPFRVSLRFDDETREVRTFGDFCGGRHVAYARVPEGNFVIEQSRLAQAPAAGRRIEWLSSRGKVQSLAPAPQPVSTRFKRSEIQPSHRYLLTNSRGSYVLQPVSPHTVHSKYDGLLAANLHPTLPDERCVLLKRIRAYLQTPIFTYPLELEYLAEFRRWPWPTWIYEFRLQEGNIRIQEVVQLSTDHNAGRVSFSWDAPKLPEHRIIIRPDVEFRGHHGETKAHGLNEDKFAAQYSPLPTGTGIGFHRETDDVEFRVQGNSMNYVHEGEWTYNIPHPHEGTRGQTDFGDAYSPGYFDIQLDEGRTSMRIDFSVWGRKESRHPISLFKETESGEPQLVQHLAARAARQFLVRRGNLKTVLAGYPWFLDWGRDTFIAARGYLAMGYVEEVKDLVLAFAALERDGTLPNALAAANDNDRDTSDAPLWFVKVVEELSEQIGWITLLSEAETKGTNLAATVASICDNYIAGTPNGIKCDAETGLVYSPAHFTWMDTNYPACTPRQGFPIEIQALWVRALEFAATVLKSSEYSDLAIRTRNSIQEYFWLDDAGYFADCVLSTSDGRPDPNRVDSTLRPNQLCVVAFGLAEQQSAHETVVSTYEHLVIPASLRSVADLETPEAVWPDGIAVPDGLNPQHPYRGRYEGDEDTSRKPAYHNGTGWGHMLPLWVDALSTAFDGDKRALRLARSVLRTYESEMRNACVGQISENFDGDAPHENRGCCAQAWAVTEFLRVWRLLDSKEGR